MDFVVKKKDLASGGVIPSCPLSLSEGDVLIKIEKFAFTANNISYAVTGESLSYWDFFPSSQGGRIPVWGIGIIVASRCKQVQEQRKVYGYFPMSHYVVMKPSNITTTVFVDGSPHRKELPAVYNQYSFCTEDPFYTPSTEEAMMILRPLYFTSWLLVDFFRQMDFCGAQKIILSSASSKTSIGLAFTLQQYNQNNTKGKDKVDTVGLTSAGNLTFVRDLGIYDQCILYDDIEKEIDVTTPSCFVDMAGNTQVTTRLHSHLGEQLKYSCLVGAAHVGKGGKPVSNLPGARPKFFFAPSWTARRIVELGKGQKGSSSKRRGLQILLHNVLIDYRSFVDWCLGNQSDPGWLQIVHFLGENEIVRGYSACLNRNIKPNQALVMSMWETRDTYTHAKL